MLPAAHRLRSSAEFSAVVRRGRRASRPLLTLHLLQPEISTVAAAGGSAPALAGLVVSKAVGGSVERHRTARQLRHLLAPHLTGSTRDVPPGTRLVVRANPPAGSATSAALRADLDAAFARLLRTEGARGSRSAGAADELSR